MFQLLSNTSTAQLPTFIASASTSNSSTGTTLVINKPTGTLDGHLMIAFMYNGSTAGAGSSTWTGDTGWTEILDQGSSPDLRIAYKVASSEGSSYTFTNSTTALLSGSILTYSNAAYDTIGTITTIADPLVITAVTTSVNNCMCLGVAGRSQPSITITSPGSMTTRVTENDAKSPSYCIAEELIPTLGSTGTRTFSGLGGSSGTSGVLVSIKPA